MQRFRARRRRDRLSRRGRGRADRAGARLCLDRGGELGQSRLGRDADAGPAGASSRSTIAATALRPSSTIPPPITAPSWPRTCARCSIISISRRADVMGYSMGARITAFLALAHPARVRSAVLGGLGIRLVEGVGLPREHRGRARGAVARRCRRSDRAHVPRLRRADQVRPQGARRLHPRLAPDPLARRGRAASARRCWSRSAPGTTSPAPRTSSPRCMPGGRALDIPERDHMLAVGDKVFKAGVLTSWPSGLEAAPAHWIGDVVPYMGHCAKLTQC